MTKASIRHGFFHLSMALRALAAPVAFGVAGAVMDEAGRVLLVRQSYAPGWRLPGGGVGRGEAPAGAILRELAEEVCLSGGTAELLGLYTRRAGWGSHVVALYRITGATLAFRPNLEVRAIQFVDPAAPPPGTAPGTARRLAELAGAVPVVPYW